MGSILPKNWHQSKAVSKQIIFDTFYGNIVPQYDASCKSGSFKYVVKFLQKYWWSSETCFVSFTSNVCCCKSDASFYNQVIAWVPDIFCNFYLVKNHKIANELKLEKKSALIWNHQNLGPGKLTALIPANFRRVSVAG